MGKSWKWTSRWTIESLDLQLVTFNMDKDENHKRNNHHLGMGQDIYHKKKFTCTLSFSNGGQHCNTTNVEEVVEIIIDIDKVEPMSKVVQNYFQLNIHVLQFGYSFNPIFSTI